MENSRIRDKHAGSATLQYINYPDRYPILKIWLWTRIRSDPETLFGTGFDLSDRNKTVKLMQLLNLKEIRVVVDYGIS